MKYLKYIILFLLIFFGGQFVIVTGLGIIISKSNFRYAKLYNQKQENEILFIGNSRGVNSIYVPYLIENKNIKAANLSFNGIPADMIVALLKDYLDRNPKPKKIFIEASCLFFDDSTRLESNEHRYPFNMFVSESGRISDILYSKDDKLKYINSILPLYCYNSQYLYRSLYYLNKPNDFDWINKGIISNEVIRLAETMKPFEMLPDIEGAKKLADFLREMKALNIEANLYIAPYQKDYLVKFTNFEQLKEQIEDATGSAIIDLSGLLMANQYFADRLHNNIEGAKIVSEKLYSFSNP